MKRTFFTAAFMILTAFWTISCGGGNNDSADSNNDGEVESLYQKDEPIDPMKDKGVGPVKEVTLGRIDDALAQQGEELYKLKCSSCHKEDEKYIGPAHRGVTKRRTPEWIMNMILNPEGMLAEDPVAKQLQSDFLSPMANQNLTEEEARAILEYFRKMDAEDTTNLNN